MLSLVFKVDPSEVCGCPLVNDPFKESGDFCRAPKRSCLRHYRWEKLRRAEIDLQRVQEVGESCTEKKAAVFVLALTSLARLFESGLALTGPGLNS